MNGKVEVVFDEIDIAVVGTDFDFDFWMELEERSRRRNQVQRCKSGWTADPQQPGWLEPAMRNLKLCLFNIFKRGLEALIVGKAGFRRVRTTRGPTYQLDPDVLLNRGQ